MLPCSLEPFHSRISSLLGSARLDAGRLETTVGSGVDSSVDRRSKLSGVDAGVRLARSASSSSAVHVRPRRARSSGDAAVLSDWRDRSASSRASARN